MSAPTYPASPPPYGPAPTRRRSVASMVIGWILLVIGFCTAVTGVVLFAVFGDGSPVSSNQNTMSTQTPALVGDLGTIQNVSNVRFTGMPRLLVTVGTAEKPAFIGIARTDDVNRYLTGVARDQISDFDLSPFVLTTARQDGTDKATRPADQTFWAAKVESGATSQLSWEIAEGSYSIVIMNADGSAGVNTQASVGVSFPNSKGLWISVIAVGAALLIGGIVLVVIGSKRVPLQPYGAGYPPPGPPPGYAAQP